MQLAAGAQTGKLPAFRRVVIETTGLADPTPILHALMADERLAAAHAIDSVVTTVDAENGLATPGATPRPSNKLRSPTACSSARPISLTGRHWLHCWRGCALNPTAEIILSRDGDAPAAALVGAALESRAGGEVVNWF